MGLSGILTLSALTVVGGCKLHC
ncbi:unnamed protein product [Kuraishia capsulata CBS 1993]|uniref:Uncharacterized protein n=1 Tax=Kuraishia capsulata CBS 1993 TaxID=1382522 RepID=W6MVX3_9ASCO|nr:unnamed protein product [Kuraishia capsulata CBS 1993]